LPFPPRVLDELKALTAVSLDEEAAGNAKFKQIYRAYNDFRQTYRDWSDMADDAYTRLAD